MKTIMPYLLISFLIYYLSSISTLYGQTDPINIPFNIDIKKNVRNIKTVYLSSIGKELQYIPLETTPECLINEIDDIEFSDSYIFVNERKRLLQFDKNGKFIRQIGSQGRGPEEYLDVMDFCINNQTQEIYILSFYQNLVFGFDGRFKSSFKLSIRPSQIIIKDQNSLMFHSPNVPGPKIANPYSWIITDKQGNTKQTFKNHLMRVSQPGIVIMESPLYMFNNIAHFLEFGIDTLYYFYDTQKKPYAIFNLDNLKMDPDPLITAATKEKVGEKLFDKLWINSIYENNDFLFIKFFRGITDSTICALYNKKTSDVAILKDNAFKNDLDGGIMFWPKQIIDNILVDYIDGFELLKKIKKMQYEGSKEKGRGLSTKLSKLGKQLTETSNPVLIVVNPNK